MSRGSSVLRLRTMWPIMGQVTAHAGQLDSVSMASDSIPRSLRESPARQRVRHLPQQGLARRIAPPQGVEPDVTGVEIHLRTDQAVGPRRRDLEMTAQELDAAGRPGAPQVEDPTVGPRLEVQGPVLGERSAWWCRLDPRRSPHPAGGHVLGRLGLQALQRRMREAGPDLRLPAAVVIPDRPGFWGS